MGYGLLAFTIWYVYFYGERIMSLGKRKKLLTESQVLKMCKGEYMNKDQLEFFRYRLEGARDDCNRDILNAKAMLVQEKQVSDDSDSATENEINLIDTRFLERKSNLLRKIESALDRIAESSYGYCQITREPIGLKRLLLRPTATLSIEAKQLQENIEKHYSEEE